MYIESIKGQSIEISFESTENQIFLGDILKIAGAGKNGVLVQVEEVKTSDKNPNFNVAATRAIFTITPEGQVYSWKGNAPGPELTVSKLSDRQILPVIKAAGADINNLVNFGELSLYPRVGFNFDLSFLEFPTVIVSDKQSLRDKSLLSLSGKIAGQGVKTLLLDFNGEYDLENAFVLKAGRDLKLPFDLKGLENLYNIGLKDASVETKAVVEEIFSEIEEYLSSNQVDFVPFELFKDAVDSEYENNKISQLALLKNKLNKINKSGIFSNTNNEVFSIFNVFKNSNLVNVDLSEIPGEWKPAFVSFISEYSAKYDQSFVLLADYEGTDSELNYRESVRQFKKSGICSVISLGHSSEFIEDSIDLAENFIIFAPELTTRFLNIQNFLNRLGKYEALITGNLTNKVAVFSDLSADFCENIEVIEIPADKEDTFISEVPNKTPVFQENQQPEVGVSLETLEQAYSETGKPAESHEVIEYTQSSSEDFSEIEQEDNLQVQQEYQEVQPAYETGNSTEIDQGVYEQYQSQFGQDNTPARSVDYSETREEDEPEYTDRGSDSYNDIESQLLDGQEYPTEPEYQPEALSASEGLDYDAVSEFQDASLQDYAEQADEAEQAVYEEEVYPEEPDEAQHAREDFSHLNQYEEGDVSSPENEFSDQDLNNFVDGEAASSEYGVQTVSDYENEVTYQEQEEISDQDSGNFVGDHTETSGYSPQEAGNYESEANYKEYQEISDEDLSNFVDDDVEYQNEPEGYEEDFDYSASEDFQDDSILDYVGAEASEPGVSLEGQRTAEIPQEEEAYPEEPEDENFQESYAGEEDFSQEAGYAEEKNRQEPVSIPPSTANIPVYNVPSSEEDVSDLGLQEGDVVQHQKYGVGVIKKIIGYSGKQLCSIQFDSVGRRLLDPRLAELTKIEQ